MAEQPETVRNALEEQGVGRWNAGETFPVFRIRLKIEARSAGRKTLARKHFQFLPLRWTNWERVQRPVTQCPLFRVKRHLVNLRARRSGDGGNQGEPAGSPHRERTHDHPREIGDAISRGRGWRLSWRTSFFCRGDWPGVDDPGEIA